MPVQPGGLTELPCRSMFEAPLRIRDGRITNLRISLPPNFPTGRPGLAVRSSPPSPLTPPHADPFATLFQLSDAPTAVHAWRECVHA